MIDDKTQNHHPSKMDVLSKTYFQIILAAKWLVRHSSKSPTIRDDLCPFFCIYGIHENKEVENLVTHIHRDNINVVIPGQFKVPEKPNGVKQCKKDSTTGGKRVCTYKLGRYYKYEI